jgi:hypothetical protein
MAKDVKCRESGGGFRPLQEPLMPTPDEIEAAVLEGVGLDDARSL